MRNKLGYGGVIISDDMVMKGVADFGKVQAVEMGIKAGLNMFIYRNSDSQIINTIENIYKIAQNSTEIRHNIEYSFEKIIQLKTKMNI